jgi:hypothetical protein
VITGLDLYVITGESTPYVAYQTTIDGIIPDFAGTVTVVVTQHDPVSGDLLPECSNNGAVTGAPIGEALICAIEVLQPQGQGPSAYAINSGGPAISPTVPVVTANYAYSAAQETYGIRKKSFDDPLIATQVGCQNVGDYWANYSAWARNTMRLRVPSIGQLQPGDMIKFYHPKLNVDMWAYISDYTRTQDTSSNTDEYGLYVIYTAERV